MCRVFARAYHIEFANLNVSQYLADRRWLRRLSGAASVESVSFAVCLLGFASLTARRATWHAMCIFLCRSAHVKVGYRGNGAKRRKWDHNRSQKSTDGSGCLQRRDVTP